MVKKPRVMPAGTSDLPFGNTDQLRHLVRDGSVGACGYAVIGGECRIPTFTYKARSRQGQIL